MTNNTFNFHIMDLEAPTVKYDIDSVTHSRKSRKNNFELRSTI